MKSFKDILVLAAIPLIIFLLSFMYACKGPYYFGDNSDPEYSYLFNSLNILNFERPYHTDHPGTPLQVLGAVVLLGKGILNHSSTSLSVIRTSVLLSPEDYLQAINLVLNILICAIAFWTGLRLFYHTKRLAPALILQFTLLCFFQVQVSLVRVSPEPFLVLSVLLLAPLLVAEVLADEGETARQANIMRPLLTGMVIGLGLAAKVTFFPLLFFIFTFEGLQRKSVVVTGCILSFIFFTLPILPEYVRMFHWFTDLLLHEGRYGTGAVGLPAIGTLLLNVKELFLGEPLLLVSCAFYLFGSMFIKYGKSTRDALIENKIKKLLRIGCLIILAQVAVTSKHPHLHYLLPSMVVSCIMNACLIYVLLNDEHRSQRVFSSVLVMVLLIAFAFNGARVQAWIQENKQYASATAELLARVKTIDHSYKVGFYRSSLPQYALAFGNAFAGGVYGKELARLYPDTIFYQKWQDFFYTYEGGIIKEDYLQTLINRGDKFIMIGTPDSLKNKDRLITEPLFVNVNEGIFRLVRIE
ncbi:MAG: hypothetical protein HGA43_08020 [Nitrospirae bacterium]|nr:hypothetical protein [Nitrospirota bacterium]